MTTRLGHPEAGSHDTHDRLVVAARAAGDLTGRELDRAEALLAACDRCRTLLGELRVIALATRGLPPAPRPPALDFRLAPGRAASLARGRWWRRLLRPFGSAGNGTVRPLAAALTTLGLAGLLVAALPTLPLGGASIYQASSGAAIERQDASQESLGFVALPPGQPPAGTLGPKVQEPAASVIPSVVAPEGAAGYGAGSTAPIPDAADPGPAEDSGRIGDEPARSGGFAPLVPLSLALLGAGLGLFLLRRAAVRLC